MTHVRLKLDAAATGDWLAVLSTDISDTTFSVLATIPAEEGLLGIVDVRTSDGAALVRAVEDVPQVDTNEVIHLDDRRVVFQFTSSMTESYDVLRSSGTVPRYPVTLRNGWFSGRLTATQEQLTTYVDELAAAGIPYDVVSVTHSVDSHDLLTERQWQVVLEAVDRGYYEASRGCTLADLAETFDVTESAVSKLLSRAERRIVTEFVTVAAP